VKKSLPPHFTLNPNPSPKRQKDKRGKRKADKRNSAQIKRAEVEVQKQTFSGWSGRAKLREG